MNIPSCPHLLQWKWLFNTQEGWNKEEIIPGESSRCIFWKKGVDHICGVILHLIEYESTLSGMWSLEWVQD